MEGSKKSTAYRRPQPNGTIRIVDPRIDPEEVERAKQKRAAELEPIIAVPEGRTDNRAATDFAQAYRERLRYVPAWRKWLAWDGARWQIDDDDVCVTQLARQYVDGYWNLLRTCSTVMDPREFASVAKWVQSANQVSRVKAIIQLARCDESLVVNYRELNTQRGLLNVLNGTLNLDTGNLSAHAPADNITQLAQVEFHPEADCPQWHATLSMIFDGDIELINYVQRLMGYSITGYCGEAILPVCYGNGANGKSTLWNALIELLGDYGLAASDKLVMGQSREHSTELANLYQRRFVAIAEPEEGAQLQEARVKALTGDSQITARRMREDFWTFERTHKFWIATNHLPRVSGTDDGIWRRLKVIPFAVDLRTKVSSIPDYHRHLVRDEGPGILNWLLAGYRDYKQQGFGDPEAVRKATTEYRQSSDELSQFVDDCLIAEPTAVIRAKDAFECYCDWKGADRQALTSTKFGIEMGKRFMKEKPTFGPYRRQTIYRGVRLPTDSD